MSDKESLELRERLRLVEGLLAVTLVLMVLVLVLSSAVLVFQLSPGAAETAGSSLSLVGYTGTIWYTLDGNDPRAGSVP